MSKPIRGFNWRGNQSAAPNIFARPLLMAVIIGSILIFHISPHPALPSLHWAGKIKSKLKFNSTKDLGEMKTSLVSKNIISAPTLTISLLTLRPGNWAVSVLIFCLRCLRLIVFVSDQADPGSPRGQSEASIQVM